MRNDSGIIIVGALVAVLLDVVLSPGLPVFSNTPNFMIAYTVAIAFLGRGNAVYGVAFALGLLSDLLGYGPVGLLSLLLLAAVAAVRAYLNQYVGGKGISGIVAVLCVVLAVEALHAMGAAALVAGVNPVDAVVYVALPCGVFDCVLCVLAYVVMSRLLVPKRTSYGKKPPSLRRF